VAEPPAHAAMQKFCFSKGQSLAPDGNMWLICKS
jgi:hypothetical protein